MSSIEPTECGDQADRGQAPRGQRSADRRMASRDRDCTFGCQDQSGIGRGALAFGRGLRRRRERIVRRNRQRGWSFCLHFARKSAKGRVGCRIPASRSLAALRALPSKSSRPIGASASNEGHRTPMPLALSSICSKLSPIRPGETRKIAPHNDPILRAGTNVRHPELTTGPGMERRSFNILSHEWHGYPSMDSIIRWRKTALPLPSWPCLSRPSALLPEKRRWPATRAVPTDGEDHAPPILYPGGHRELEHRRILSQRPCVHRSDRSANGP